VQNFLWLLRKATGLFLLFSVFWFFPSLPPLDTARRELGPTSRPNRSDRGRGAFSGREWPIPTSCPSKAPVNSPGGSPHIGPRTAAMSMSGSRRLSSRRATTRQFGASEAISDCIFHPGAAPRLGQLGEISHVGPTHCQPAMTVCYGFEKWCSPLLSLKKTALCTKGSITALAASASC
jgi:hypothetical protein